MEILLLILFYLIGVVLALVAAAFYNARCKSVFDEFPTVLCIFSWVSFIILIISIILEPFGNLVYKCFDAFYERLFNFFKNK